MFCLSCRDDALAELSAAYSDMDAMQATLADSAVFVRYLRRRVTQLEGMEAAASAELKAAQQKRTREAPGELGWSAVWYGQICCNDVHLPAC